MFIIVLDAGKASLILSFRLRTTIRPRSKGREALSELLTDKVREGLRSHFKEVVEKKKFAPDDVAAGRKYVEAYVVYIHYVEELYEAAVKPVVGHYPETD
jgi:Family of unknown function (DUF6448)